MNSLKLNSNLDNFEMISDLQNNDLLKNYLELNILSNIEKICSLNCSYCKLGENVLKINSLKNKNYNSPIQIVNELGKIQNNLILQGTNLDHLLISGNGEPSIHPQFGEVSKALTAWRDQFSPQTKLVLFTNGVHFQTKRSLAQLKPYNEVFFKMDCLDDITFRRLNKPIVRTDVSKLVRIAQQIPNISIQTLFVTGEIDNTTDNHIEEYIEVISMLKPKRILLETISEDINNLKACEDIFLYNLANKLKQKVSSDIIVNI